LTGLLLLGLTFIFALNQNPAEPHIIIEHDEQVRLNQALEPLPTLDPRQIEAGRLIYLHQNCARCHSIAGRGNPRNPLDGVGARRSAEELRAWTIGAQALGPEALPERVFRIKHKYNELPADELNAMIIYLQSLNQSLRPGDPAEKDQP